MFRLIELTFVFDEIRCFYLKTLFKAILTGLIELMGYIELLCCN